jgi:flagellar basal-body rod protein FlgF
MQCFISKLLVVAIVSLCNSSYGSNAAYVNLSNQKVRKTQLTIVANNVANSSTHGYEEENLRLKNLEVKQSKSRSNSFVQGDSLYKTGFKGELTVTDRQLDLAILGEGYFKILTPVGSRYTLAGNFHLNREYVLVNSAGFPVANVAGENILIPENTLQITIAEDGAIYADEQPIDFIGVFDIDEAAKFTKEGKNLYKLTGQDRVLIDEVKIMQGALRASNVNSVEALSNMVDLQRSFDAAVNINSKITELERSTISKTTK